MQNFIFLLNLKPLADREEECKKALQMPGATEAYLTEGPYDILLKVSTEMAVYSCSKFIAKSLQVSEIRVLKVRPDAM